MAQKISDRIGAHDLSPFGVGDSIVFNFFLSTKYRCEFQTRGPCNVQNALRDVVHYIRPSISTMQSSDLIQTIDDRIKFIYSSNLNWSRALSSIVWIKSEPCIVKMNSWMMHYKVQCILCTTPSPNL